MTGIFPQIYYYVPACPECGSKRTGRYIRLPLGQGNARYVEEESLKHGELVRFAVKVPQKNAYCEECGNEWHQEVHAVLVTGKELGEESAARGANARYAEFLKTHPAKRKTIFGKIFGFLP